MVNKRTRTKTTAPVMPGTEPLGRLTVPLSQFQLDRIGYLEREITKLQAQRMEAINTAVAAHHDPARLTRHQSHIKDGMVHLVPGIPQAPTREVAGKAVATDITVSPVPTAKKANMAVVPPRRGKR